MPLKIKTKKSNRVWLHCEKCSPTGCFCLSLTVCVKIRWCTVVDGFPHILSTSAFGALDRIDHVLEWVHVGCKALMVSFGWEWGSYSMGYVHVSASFRSIALAWPSSAWDMFATRNFASNEVFCETRAIWKVQRESLRTISLKWSSASKVCIVPGCSGQPPI